MSMILKNAEVVAIKDELATDIIYDSLDYAESPKVDVDEFKAAFEVVEPTRKLWEADPKEDYYQGISVMTVIRRKSDGQLFGYKYWKPIAKHGEDYLEPNGDDHGFDFGDYVFLPVEPFTITGYAHKESK